MSERDELRRRLEDALGRTGGVKLAVPALNAGFNGARLGRRNGNALEFSEYRDYQSGDDLRRLDWSVYARSEQLMVKQFSEEIDPRCDIVLDHSASMATTAEKMAAALGLAGVLAQAARQSGFALRVFHARETLEPEPQPGEPLQWRDLAFDGAANPATALAGFAGRFQPRGIRFLISDLLYDGDPKGWLTRLAAGAKRVEVLQVLADGELAAPEPGEWIFYDAERDCQREIVIDAAAAARFGQRVAAHRELWERRCREYGARLMTLEASQLLPDWRLERFFQAGLLQ